MTSSLLELQSELPRLLPLFRYAPERRPLSWATWNPALVRSANDLPQYVILGDLDPATFQQSASGWSARWQGTEDSTYFDLVYKADDARWELRQKWRGLDGGSSFISSRVPLDRAIGQALYAQFPRNWDAAAKKLVESDYQITVVEQPENTTTMCGIPDGAFRTIIFPIAVRNLRAIRQWLEEIVADSPLTYPITVDAKLVFQAVNYLEGKAPDWTTQAPMVFNQSVIETGLVPSGLPVREVAESGSAAWTLRREIYFLFIGLPFAGVTDFLSRMSTATGPIRSSSAEPLRVEFRPIIMPAGLEVQLENVAFWDKTGTTRSFLQFSTSSGEKPTQTVEDFVETERNAPTNLAKIESISSEIVTAIEQIFERVTKGRTA